MPNFSSSSGKLYPRTPVDVIFRQEKRKKKKRKGTLALLKESRAKHEILYTDVLPINYALKKWTGSLPPSRSNSIDILSTVSSMVEDHCH